MQMGESSIDRNSYSFVQYSILKILSFHRCSGKRIFQIPIPRGRYFYSRNFWRVDAGSHYGYHICNGVKGKGAQGSAVCEGIRNNIA